VDCTMFTNAPREAGQHFAVLQVHARPVLGGLHHAYEPAA
jgi:hypothetical protein